MKIRTLVVLVALVFVVGCRDGGGGGRNSILPDYPKKGTLIEERCQGTTLIREIANGSGGTTPEYITNSPQCGYQSEPEPEPEFTPEGTPLTDPYCGVEEQFVKLLALVQDVADGKGGAKTEIVEENSEQCGYVPPPEEGTILTSECVGFTLQETVADGKGGERVQDTYDSTQCGYAESCPSTPTDTGDPRFDYVNCDGILQRTDIDFAYSPESTYIETIDILVLFDTNIDTEELTMEEFVQREFDFTNKVFDQSGVLIEIRVADIRPMDNISKTVDLRGQIRRFSARTFEFRKIDPFIEESQADLTYLFMNRREEPIACGVAYLDATRSVKERIGITQCFQNSVFQPEYLRYYNRAHETFTHEVGHNLGLDHAYRDSSDVYGIFPFSYGYYIPDTDEEYEDGTYFSGFGSIMSYSDEATELFSDPLLTFELPDGRIVYNGDYDRSTDTEIDPETNAVESLNRVRYYMSRLNEKPEEEFFFNETQARDEVCYF